ncbi:MAG: CPBP family intramembrane glutamic endopeptidase [Hyphomicrobiaceae bacterium]
MSTSEIIADGGPLAVSGEPYDAHTRWSPVQAFGLTVVIAICGMLAGILVTMVPAGAAGGTAPPESAVVLGLFAAQVTMIAGALWAARARDGSAMPALSLKGPVQGGRAYFVALGMLLGGLVVLNAILAKVFGHDLTADLKSFAGLIRGPWGLGALLVIGVGAPLSEELLFRGFLQGALWRSRLGYWGAALVATAVWAAMHAGYSVVGLAEVFLIGLVFSAFLRRTGSLWVPMFCHAFYNSALALGIRYLPPSLIGF